MTQLPVTSAQTPGQDNSSRSAKNRPVDKFKDGPVRASIWENTGVKGAFRVASFEIRYKNGDDPWQSRHNFSGKDLKHLESAAREARSRIKAWQQENIGKRDARH
jgi:hypothetical protein